MELLDGTERWPGVFVDQDFPTSALSIWAAAERCSQIRSQKEEKRCADASSCEVCSEASLFEERFGGSQHPDVTI